MTRDQDALLDIVDQIELIREHGPREPTDLGSDVVREAATLHWLLIIGEAASRVSPDLRERHAEVPWRTIIDFRNLLVHGYDRIRRDRVWAVIDRELPRLEQQIRAILEELE